MAVMTNKSSEQAGNTNANNNQGRGTIGRGVAAPINYRPLLRKMRLTAVSNQIVVK